MTPFRLIEVALAAWYIAFVISVTLGPFHVFEWIRRHLPLGGLMECIICLSPWIALALWLVPDGVIVWAFAAAGLGLLLHSISGWRYNV